MTIQIINKNEEALANYSKLEQVEKRSLLNVRIKGGKPRFIKYRKESTTMLLMEKGRVRISGKPNRHRQKHVRWLCEHLNITLTQQKISNIVARLELKQKININKFKLNEKCLYVPESFPAAGYIKTMQGKGIIFPRGVIIAMGCKCERDAYICINKITHFLLTNGLFSTNI